MANIYTYKKYVEGYQVYNVVANSKEEADKMLDDGEEMDDFESLYSEPLDFEGEVPQQF